MQITPHFSSDEPGVACRDGTPYPLDQIDDEDPAGRSWRETRLMPLFEMLEIVRAELGGDPIAIDSLFRTLVYDDRLHAAHVEAHGDDGMVAPAETSQHPRGRAADVVHSKLRPHEVFVRVLALYRAGRLPQLGGLGLYPGFVHFDVRKRPGSAGGACDGHLAIWGGSRPSNIA